MRYLRPVQRVLFRPFVCKIANSLEEVGHWLSEVFVFECSNFLCVAGNPQVLIRCIIEQSVTDNSRSDVNYYSTTRGSGVSEQQACTYRIVVDSVQLRVTAYVDLGLEIEVTVHRFQPLQKK